MSLQPFKIAWTRTINHLSDHIQRLSDTAQQQSHCLDKFQKHLRRCAGDLDEILPGNHNTPEARWTALKRMDYVTFQSLMRHLAALFFRMTTLPKVYFTWERGLYTGPGGFKLQGRTAMEDGTVTIVVDPTSEHLNTTEGILGTFLHELAHAVPVRCAYQCPCGNQACRRVWQVPIGREESGHAYYWQRILMIL